MGIRRMIWSSPQCTPRRILFTATKLSAHSVRGEGECNRSMDDSPEFSFFGKLKKKKVADHQSCVK